MVGSVVISVGLMLAFADTISRFLVDNPEFEILGLFVLLLIGFVLVLEGGHEAHMTVNGADFPHIPTVDRDLHAPADVRGRPLPELVGAWAREGRGGGTEEGDVAPPKDVGVRRSRRPLEPVDT